MTLSTGSSFACTLRRSLFTVAQALALSASFHALAQVGPGDGSMWSGQVKPDFRRIKASSPEDTEQGKWIVADIKTLVSAAKLKTVPEFTVLRMDAAIPGDAFARRGDNGQLEIYYSAAFEGTLPRPEYLGKYITLAHEISHHLLNHFGTNAPAITQADELKADQMAGCLFSGVVHNLKKPLGPEDHPRVKVLWKDIKAYFDQHKDDRDDGIHASVDVRLNWAGAAGTMRCKRAIATTSGRRSHDASVGFDERLTLCLSMGATGLLIAASALR